MHEEEEDVVVPKKSKRSSPRNSGKTQKKKLKKSQKGNQIVEYYENGVDDAHLKVRKNLRLFNKHYLLSVQAKNRRPDLRGITQVMNLEAVLYPRKRIGHLPGIDVGHQFFSRAEMVDVGFHSHWLNGIDYMGNDYQEDYIDHKFPLVVSIIVSGQYEDDLDNADAVTYTGQGGHNLTGNKCQIKDQVLLRGNLALKNCVDCNVPVRVTRGHDCKSSYTKRVYTYDGLYKVVKYWAEKGISGFTVYKYRLQRMEGQPELTTDQVNFVRGRKPEYNADILKICPISHVLPRMSLREGIGRSIRSTISRL